MTQWESSSSFNNKGYDLLLSLIVLMLFITLIIHQQLLLVPAGMLASFGIGSYVYDRVAGKKLSIHNRKQTIRLFPGEHSKIYFHFFNYSHVPILNGRFSFIANEIVHLDVVETRDTPKGNRHVIPLAFANKGKAKVKVPFTAGSRGVVKFSSLHYQFPQLLNFSQIHLFFLPDFKTQIVIYPLMKPVHGLKRVIHFAYGEQYYPYSPQEDLLSPYGTRDYVMADPFHRVHWKASAKVQQLQTKVYERKVDNSWTIIVNTAERTKLGNLHVSNNLENLFSYTAYLCRYAEHYNISREIYINSRHPFSKPYFHKPIGKGKEDMKAALELLARIEKELPLTPMEKLLQRLILKGNIQQTVIFVGELDPEISLHLHYLKKSGKKIFHVLPEGNGDEAFISALSSSKEEE
ncbi:DUF58 domain-containing protein [Halobacillus salinarum]|uniref:DUF58 domain-containing protein n=1 Tax=Halobacillus salinarum TaxID=2932257 RepID=A0ABY4ENP6_9BACI|nr:DUF58 domain-containing protein [Halobacillus salinarum]UOQ46005.1 DUF58 domain-containing protein [Halobacillus salinarum]